MILEASRAHINVSLIQCRKMDGAPLVLYHVIGYRGVLHIYIGASSPAIQAQQSVLILSHPAKSRKFDQPNNDLH
jgi:hypothetical protein